jgi:hypothetical protein
VLGLAAFRAATWTGVASENEPLTSLPGAVALGSETLSVASPPELDTVAETEVS